MINLILELILGDAPQPWQISFQDSAAPGFSGIVELHNTLFFYLIVTVVGVFWVLGSIVYYYNTNKSGITHKYLNHGRFVPAHKCFKFNKSVNRYYIRLYSTYSDNNSLKVYEDTYSIFSRFSYDSGRKGENLLLKIIKINLVSINLPIN